MPGKKVITLWKCEASKLLAEEKVELYALLPAMKGATAEILAQGIKAMRAFYAGDEGRLISQLLWFGTFLARTTTVSEEDKERTRREMEDFESLHDANPFVRRRFDKGRAEGLAEERAEGLAEGLAEALVTVVELRLPSLLDLAQKWARRVKEPAVLKFVLKGIKATPSEETAPTLLETLAA